MEPVPLIPQCSSAEWPDVSYIIREVFQDTLYQREFPKNVAENLGRFKVYRQSMKDCAQHVCEVHEKEMVNNDDIGVTENCLMYNQAKFMTLDHKIRKDPVLTQGVLLKRARLVDDMNETDTEKYFLIQHDHVLPSVPERSIDYRLNIKHHCCTTDCILQNKLEKMVPGPVFLEVNECDNKSVVSADKKSTVFSDFVYTTSKTTDSEYKPVVFRAEPSDVIFYDYKMNTLYKKKFKLVNISGHSQRFCYKLLPKESKFTLCLETTTKVAPGMTATFQVTFQTDTFTDLREEIVISVIDGADVEVNLVSYRDAPLLVGFVFRDSLSWCSFDSQMFENERSEALNLSIDCGSCIVGDYVQTTLFLHNEGGIGKFFIMSEKDWCYMSVDDVGTDFVLTVDCFQLSPVYFKMDTGEIKQILFTFSPKESGLQTETLYFLCDNNVVHEIDLIGDGIEFQPSVFIKDLVCNMVYSVVQTQNNLRLVSLRPDEIEFNEIIRPLKTVIKAVTVVNQSVLDVRCAWSLPETLDCNVEVMPATFELSSLECISCDIYVTPYMSGILNEIITCIVNDNYKLDLPIKAVVGKNYFEESKMEGSSIAKLISPISLEGDKRPTEPQFYIKIAEFKTTVLRPDRVQYLNVPTIHRVNLINTTEYPDLFEWDSPFGKQVNNVCVECDPQSDVIAPFESKEIEITLTPCVVGFIEDIFLPCRIANVSEPIVLSILCSVEDLTVTFLLPNDNDTDFEETVWPPFEPPSLSTDIFELSEVEFDVSLMPSREEEMASEETMGEVTPIVELYNNPEANNPYTQSMKVEVEGESLSVWSSLQELSSETITDVTVKDMSFVKKQYRFVVNFLKVPCRTAFKKTILIQNNTPIEADFSVFVKNYKSREVERKPIDDILNDLKWKKIDIWTERLNPDFGIVVCPEPSSGILSGNQTLSLDVWVYADTWGLYSEELTCEIGNLPVFTLGLYIQIIGLPTIFPLVPAGSGGPVLKFGKMSYCSPRRTKKIKIVNISCVAVTVKWHVFLAEPEVQKNPINVLLDFQGGKETDCDCIGKCTCKCNDLDINVLITRYYGQEGYSVFNIKPREMDLKPHEASTVLISLTSDQFMSSSEQLNIRGLLVGYYHIADNDRFKENEYMRRTDSEVLHAKMKLTCKLELPQLQLDLVRGEVTLRTYASDVVQDPTSEITLQECLVFRNVNTIPIEVKMHANTPFKVVGLKTPECDVEEDDGFCTCVVYGSECVEVLVECTLTSPMIMKLAKLLKPDQLLPDTTFTADYLHDQITLTRQLNIHQRGVLYQTVELYVVIKYPQMIVSENQINFGPVYIGNEKRKTITVENRTATRLYFSIIKTTNMSEFTIEPDSGYLPAAKSGGNNIFPITICFKPQQSVRSQGIITVMTSIPTYWQNVQLHGIGLHNEKFFTYMN